MVQARYYRRMPSKQPEIERITVISRIGALPGVRRGRVAAYDHYIEERHPVRPGASRTMRYFLLLDEAVQMCQPPTWLEHDAGSWYVDLVSIVEDGDSIEVIDRDIDVIVPEPGRPYRVVDLHEFGDAIESGEHSIEDGIAALRAFQSFLEAHLNRPDGSAGPWPDFPPAAIAPLVGLQMPQPLAAD